MNSDAQPSPKPDLTAETMERLFFWARDRVASVVASLPSPDVSSLGDVGNLPVLGAFVSFKKRGRLRSCMGYMSEGIRLGEALDSSSVTAALRDPRFPPISANELYDLDLEVWILGAMREIQEQGDALCRFYEDPLAVVTACGLYFRERLSKKITKAQKR